MRLDSRFLYKLKPEVEKIWLQLVAGLVWFGVGLMLMGYAHRWLNLTGYSTKHSFALSGIILATGIYYFGFSKLARRNIRRVDALNGKKVCFFAFQSWTNYPLVVFMIALGVFLRVYSPVPKSLLGVAYLGIGGGLFSASLHYFVHIARGLRLKTAGG
ncbi:MAG: hypothetical protein ACYC6H_08130 [Bellilinea sp.]